MYCTAAAWLANWINAWMYRHKNQVDGEFTSVAHRILCTDGILTGQHDKWFKKKKKKWKFYQNTDWMMCWCDIEYTKGEMTAILLNSSSKQTGIILTGTRGGAGVLGMSTTGRADSLVPFFTSSICSSYCTCKHRNAHVQPCGGMTHAANNGTWTSIYTAQMVINVTV